MKANKDVEKARKAVMKPLKKILTLGPKLEEIDSTHKKFSGLIEKLGFAQTELSEALDSLEEEQRNATNEALEEANESD